MTTFIVNNKTYSLYSNKTPTDVKRIYMINKANELYDNKYDYSLYVYVNNSTSSIIICPLHGQFSKNMSNHTHPTRPQQCPDCQKIITKETKSCWNTKHQDEYIKEVNELYNNKYDYSLFVYIDAKTKSTVICPNHGSFEITPDNHRRGHGCGKCHHDNQKIPFKKQIEQANIIHKNKYDYSMEEREWVSGKDTIPILCPLTGLLYQRLDGHVAGVGCDLCSSSKGFSKDQILWLEWRMVRDNCFIQHKLNGGEYQIKNYPVDGFCKETQIVYEYNGDFWHGNPMKYNILKKDCVNRRNQISYGELYNDTIVKKHFIINEGYHYISIWESEWLHIKKCIKIIQRWWKKNK